MLLHGRSLANYGRSLLSFTSRVSTRLRKFSSATSDHCLVTQLPTRGVLRLSGDDTLKYLQGLITNDTDNLRHPSFDPSYTKETVSCMYAALLNPQGRVLYDLFLHSQVDKDDRLTLFADVDTRVLPDVVAHLKRYRLRAKVDVADVSDECSVWARFGSDGTPGPSSSEQPVADTAAPGAARPSVGVWVPDPRLRSLGYRGIFSDSPHQPPPDEPPLRLDTAEGYTDWRYAHGVGEGAQELRSGEMLPLEANLAGLNAVSFKKGCYVGQELTARTHFRGVIRKRIMPVTIEESEEQAALPPDTPPAIAAWAGNEVVASQDGDRQKKVGRLAGVSGDRRRGIALLRLGQALDLTMTHRVIDSDVKLVPHRPAWWPAEWGHEDQG